MARMDDENFRTTLLSLLLVFIEIEKRVISMDRVV